jgi:hypothetical protein
MPNKKNSFQAVSFINCISPKIFRWDCPTPIMILSIFKKQAETYRYDMAQKNECFADKIHQQ